MSANEPAFPASTETGFGMTGLTRRELFAAMAMQAFISNPANVGRTSPQDIASAACGAADALIAQLSKEPT